MIPLGNINSLKDSLAFFFSGNAPRIYLGHTLGIPSEDCLGFHGDFPGMHLRDTPEILPKDSPGSFLRIQQWKITRDYP